MKSNRCTPILLAIMLLLVCGCSDDPGEASFSAKWLRSPDDYQQLGIEKEIKTWEDGFRSADLADSFEWWYFDAHLDDGTVVVAWVGHDWPPGVSGWRFVLDITPPNGETVVKYIEADKPDYVNRDKADVRMGKHRFEGNLDAYRIVVDPETMDGYGIDMTLTRNTPPYRPATGHFGSTEKYFAWLVAVPEGKVKGTLTMNNKTRPVAGSGYHDHNWGNIAPNELMSNWWWGRAAVGKYTIVMAELRAKPEYGGGDHPLLLVTSPQGDIVDVVGSEELDLIEDKPKPHPDPRHDDPIATGATLKVHRHPVMVRFGLSDKILTSVDILDTVSFPRRMIGRLLGASPWYTRVESPVELTVNKRVEQGRGTLEFMDFE